MYQVINCLKDAFEEISELIRYSNLIEISNEMETNNESGDTIKKIDYITNNIIKNKLRECNDVRYICSEEETDIVLINEKGKYLVSFDPLDGSSNVSSNISVGSIFCIFEYVNDKIENGKNIIASGYSLYSTSTQLVLAYNNKVDLYILEKKDGFKLIKNNIKIPKIGSSYAINEGNKYKWIDSKINKFIDNLIGQKKTQRWVGSMVADINRILINGGVFMYPGDEKSPNGKIRLLYEAYPMAYIFKCAKGYSNILDMPFPENYHKKVPVLLFGENEYNLYLSL